MTEETRAKLDERLRQDARFLREEGYEVIAIFVYGSQNYLLDHEGSDIDTKAMVLPKFEDFVLGNKMTSFTHKYPNGEQIDVKDVRLMFENYKKQNINFVETLYSQRYYVAPSYRKPIAKIMRNETIARYDEARTVKAAMGMTFEKYKALCHPYPSIAHKIEKYGYDGKQLSHMFRLANFLHKYTQGRPYQECLLVEPQLRDHLIAVKTNSKYDLETAKIIGEKLCKANQRVANAYIRDNNLKKNQAAQLLDNITIDIFRQYFRNRFQ